jgi:DNA-binding response OmpR family regulator
MTVPLRILLLEDNPADAELNEHILRKAGLEFESLRVEDEAAYVAALENFRPNLVLADYKLPHFDGLQALKLLREKDADLPFIFVTGSMGEELAVESLHLGANDYLLKDRISRLPVAIERAMTEARQRAQLRRAERESRASEIRYRRLFESIRDAQVVVDMSAIRPTSTCSAIPRRK